MSSFSKCAMPLLLLGAILSHSPKESNAHPMDSYAIDQYMDFRTEGNEVKLIYRIEFAEIPTASELPRVDTDRDMSLSSEETVPYVQNTVDQLLEEMVLTIDGDQMDWKYQRGEAFLDTLPSTRLKMVAEFRTSYDGELGEGRQFRFDLRHRPTARGDRQTRIATRGMTALEGVASSENVQPPGMAPPAILDTAALMYGHKVQWTVVPSETMAPEEVPDFSIRDATGPPPPANPFLSLNQRDLGDEIMGEPPMPSGGIDPATVTAVSSLRDEGAPTYAEGGEAETAKETWADRKFRQMFLDSEAGKASLGALIGFSLLSLLYGAAHALEPGHGKTVVAAYLVGSHGTVFHAVLLALIVTFTHTFSVYILGVIALTNLEKVQGTYLPILEIGSWFLILCMGLWLFLKYYKYYVQGKLADPTFHTHGFGEGHTHLPDGSHPHDHGHGHHHHHDHGHHHQHKHDHPHSHAHHHANEGEAHHHTHDHKHDHSHDHDHSHEHKHDEGHAHTHEHNHSHGEGHSHAHDHKHDHKHPHPHNHDHGHSHSHDHPHDHKHSHGHDHHHDHGHGHHPPHDVPTTEVSFWNLLVLGVTGGIVPCPGALFVMMIALTSGAVLTGLYLITVFSVGLALTLMGVGIAVVKGRGAIDKYAPNPKVIQLVPIFTSLVIAFVGLAFMINGMMKHGIIALNL